MTPDNVISLASHRRPTPADVDKAWGEYVALAGQVVDNPKLMIDRQWFEETTRRHERFKRLFLAAEESR